MRPRLALPIWLLGLALLIELIVADTAGNPGTTITKFRKLV